MYCEVMLVWMDSKLPAPSLHQGLRQRRRPVGGGGRAWEKAVVCLLILIMFVKGNVAKG
jgi:hypothetical protein